MSQMLQILAELKQLGLINQGDFYFAKLIDDKQQPFDYPPHIANLATLLAALANFSQRQGNTCLFLDKALGKNLFDLAYSEHRAFIPVLQQAIDYLPVEQWQSALQQAQHIAFSSQPLQQTAPLVFQFDALYFYRTWQDEFRLAAYLGDELTPPA